MSYLEQKKALMLKINEIASMQRSAVQEADMQKLQQLIDERQRCMDAIDAISDDSFDHELADIIEQIQDIDKDTHSMLEHMMHDVDDKLGSIKNTRIGLIKYNAGVSQIPPAFVDKKM
jgi:phosphoglycerate-specific signal transduction histidine kinase